MKTFKCISIVVSIYNSMPTLLVREYSAESKEKALQGFIKYLESNKNLVTFNNVKVEY